MSEILKQQLMKNIKIGQTRAKIVGAEEIVSILSKHADATLDPVSAVRQKELYAKAIDLYTAAVNKQIVDEL